MSIVTNEWPSNTKGYKVMNSIGCGYFGTVWRAEVLEGKHKGEIVAIKMIELDKCADDKINGIRRSMLLANLLDHPNILSYKIAFICKQELWLVSEIMECGSIDRIIQALYPNGLKDQTLIATILKEALKGLIYLHQNNQIHRDIRGASVLVDSEGLIKISDFGVATAVKEGEKKNTVIGSPCWMAPEVLDQDDKNGYDFKADIWSLGITALEIAQGKPPNSDLCTMKLILKTLNEEPPKLNDESCWDDSFKEFISYCLVKDPAKRKSADELLKSCRTFFSKSKGPEYVKEKLIKGFDAMKICEQTLGKTQHPSECSTAKRCSILFDFQVATDEESEDSGSVEDLQVKTGLDHLTKEESEYMLCQSLQNSYATRHFSRSFKGTVPKINTEEKNFTSKATCLVTPKMVHKEKGEKLMLSKGDCTSDFPFLNEEEN